MIRKLAVFCALLAAPAITLAQQSAPARGFSQAELVSFTRDMPMNMALQILSNYAKQYEQKIIIDREGRTGAIGVAVENMHWKRALEYILRSNLLKYDEFERYLEINAMTEQAEPPAGVRSIGPETPEVEIDAVFFQADFEALFELGIDWSTFRQGTVDIRARGGSSVAQDFFSIGTAQTISGTVRVDALLRAFESRNRGEIVARPHIRVMDGEAGKIKVGKNFFLTIQDFAGNTRFNEYESGIILTVTPTVLGSEDSTFIHLTIEAERSDVVPDPIGVTKNTTESDTQVLLRNGEETVIAGLVNLENVRIRKGVPILKDLPWWFFGLKYLFGYESKSVKKKELVLFIRARLVPSLFTRRRTRVNARSYLDAKTRETEGMVKRAPKRTTTSSRRATPGNRRNVGRK